MSSSHPRRVKFLYFWPFFQVLIWRPVISKVKILNIRGRFFLFIIWDLVIKESLFEFGQFYNLTLSQCLSVRERPKFLKNWQSRNFDKGFQKKKLQADLRKSIFWKMTFSREHGLKFYKPFFKSFSRFESRSFFNVKKSKS